jgi:hypothetical protein
MNMPHGREQAPVAVQPVDSVVASTELSEAGNN